MAKRPTGKRIRAMPDRYEHAKNISRAVMKPIRTRYVLGFWVSDDLDLTEGHRLRS
jgi:hypothetical protein